ncbi:MAG: NAD(P)-dependent oxidoreductase [Kistimonas sp.]|nr:NAD(P)-dependent oxidoreductase [Kistimonas sp.]
MEQTSVSLKGKTVFITGSSRGIGRAIALRCAQEGAQIVVAAKSDQPHPQLEGTIHTVADEIKSAGGQALALRLDVRDPEQVQQAVDQAAEHFGGIDILINNAGAVSLGSVEETSLKQFDLMQQVNVRAVFLCTRTALPLLKRSSHAQVLNIAPPLSIKPHWVKARAGYTVSKYGISLLTLGMAGEFRGHGIAVNALWPKTLISTAALTRIGGEKLHARSRKPAIMADAAREVLITPDLALTGQLLVDEDLLRTRGVTDFDHYACHPEQAASLLPDLYVD